MYISLILVVQDVYNNSYWPNEDLNPLALFKAKSNIWHSNYAFYNFKHFLSAAATTILLLVVFFTMDGINSFFLPIFNRKSKKLGGCLVQIVIFKSVDWLPYILTTVKSWFNRHNFFGKSIFSAKFKYYVRYCCVC